MSEKILTAITANGVEYKIGGANKITWDANSNMNDFKEAGIYDIYGERTMITDNMPILNTGAGHSIAGRLTVVVSTLQPDNNEKCITQLLMLSNRLGGDGNMYVRTYNENNSPARDWWSPWQKLQGVKEGYIYTDTAQINPDGGVQQVAGVTGICNMVDNGVYSGIYVNNTNLTQSSILETFTLIVINDYAAVGVANQMFGQETLQRQVCQLKYATDAATGTAYIKKRTFKGNNDGYKNPSNWSDWEDIGGGNNYLGIKSLTELRDNNTIKSGTYCGLLSDHNNYPFILEVTTNFDTNNVDDKEKLGLKRLLVGTVGNNYIEYISKGIYLNSVFRYSSFTIKNDKLSYNIFERLDGSYSTTMIINKFDDSITIPNNYSVLYNHIMNTAKNISNIKSVYIKTSPGKYEGDSGGILTSSIIEVVYGINFNTIQYKYEKLVLNISTPSKVFVIQPLIELQELE